LPSEEEMNADEEEDFQERLSLGPLEKHAHYLAYAGLKWDYDSIIARLAGVDALIPVYNDLRKHVA